MNIKVITLNMWLGGLLMDNIIKFLQKENPDILFLQEVHNSEDASFPKHSRSIQVLQQNLNLKHHVFSPSFKDITPTFTTERGNCIFSHHPLREVTNIAYDTPYQVYDDVESHPEEFAVLPRNLQHVVADINNQELQLFNTHGVWATDGDDNERRLKMSETIVHAIKDKKNVILAGDFNVKPHTQTIGNIEKYLANVFKDELVSTFNMKHKDNPGYATAVVDMMFISQEFKVVDHYCPQVDVSDHLPLVAVLAL